MASISYPRQKRSDARLGEKLSKTPIGAQDVRNPNRISFPDVDLRGSGRDLATRPGAGPVLHGEVLGPRGRPLDSSRAATVKSAIKGITIEGELGRPNSPRAKRLRDIVEKNLGKGAAFGLLGLMGFDISDNLAIIQDAIAEGWTHPNGLLDSSCAPGSLPGGVSWLGDDLLTGHTGASCTQIVRASATSWPTDPSGYPIADFGNSADAIGYTFFRWSSNYSTGGSLRRFQIAERYTTIDAGAELGPVWADETPIRYYPMTPTIIDLGLGDYSILGPKGKAENDQPSRRPWRAPYRVPAVDINWHVGPASRTLPRPRSDTDTGTTRPPPKYPEVTFKDHIKMPPGPKVRERKRAGVPKALWKAVMFAGAVTEACEAVDVFYKALPWQLRRWKGRDGKWRDKEITCHMRALAVFRNAASINVEEALIGLVENEIKDRVIGKANQAATNAAIKAGYPGARGPTISRIASGQHQDAINEVIGGS